MERKAVSLRDVAAVVSVALRFIPQVLDEYYASPEFARASAHSSEFIGAINTYLTETYPVALPSA